MIEPIYSRTPLTSVLLLGAASVALLGLRFQNDVLFGIAVFLLVLCGLVWVVWKLTFFRIEGGATLKEIRAFQGEKIEVDLFISNKKALPILWLNGFYDIPADLSLDMLREQSGESMALELSPNPSAGRQTLRTFWSLRGYQTLHRKYLLNCKKRGFYRLGPLKIESGDPFGFYAGRKRFDEQPELIIYPHIFSLADMRLPANLPFGDARAKGRLFEDPLRTIGVREWEQGDQMRRIHWKVTARQQALHSRVYEPAEEEQILIFLNVATLEKHWQGYFPELQERAISTAAGLAYQIAEQRLPIGLIANGYMPGRSLYLRAYPGRAPGQLTHILELLARVTPMAIGSLEELILLETPRIPMGTTLIIVTAVTYPSLLAVLEEVSAAGRSVVLFTLAEEPPDHLHNIEVYHIGHLSEDLDEVVEPIQIQ